MRGRSDSDYQRRMQVTHTAAQVRDLIVIGNGLAGSSAASAAAARGLAVTLVGARDTHPEDFRGEKLGEAQVALLDRTGLGAAARRQLTPFDGVVTYRFGKRAATSTAREHASAYGDLVNALLRAIPASVERATGRVEAIVTSDTLQTVRLADGREIAGRLVAVASGLGHAVRRLAGIDHRILSPTHSLSIGFDLVRPASDFAFPSLVWHRDEADRALSYLTLFPIGQTMRGNLFVYRAPKDPWVERFRADPAAALAASMPGLVARFGPLAISGRVVLRPVDLLTAQQPVRPGMVLLGDAGSVVCPTTGMGMGKALNDADRLANHHLPLWLATPGMGADKIAAYYADPVKTRLDRDAMRASLVGRPLQMDDGVYWRARRLLGRLRFRRHGADALHDTLQPAPAG